MTCISYSAQGFLKATRIKCIAFVSDFLLAFFLTRRMKTGVLIWWDTNMTMHSYGLSLVIDPYDCYIKSQMGKTYKQTVTNICHQDGDLAK
jgi:hypothetical protein